MIHKASIMEISIVALLLLVMFFSPAIARNSQPDIKSLCAETPYPQKCESSYFKYGKSNSIKSKSGLLKLSLQHAYDHSLSSWKNAYSLGPKCRNKQEQAAWNDCVKYYGQISDKLNKTVDPNTKCTSEDVQTWLSATLTYMETCKEGFSDLGVTDNVMSSVHDEELANLICNNLAINKGYYGGSGYEDGFPSWVSHHDRKLLQSSNPAAQANVVVAQDGSGNYKTVSAAVASAPGNKRYVIHVKAGTYKENVEITAKFVTLIGDGIDQTIITGSKSVDGGSTTSGSATVGKYSFLVMHTIKLKTRKQK